MISATVVGCSLSNAAMPALTVTRAAAPAIVAIRSRICSSSSSTVCQGALAVDVADHQRELVAADARDQIGRAEPLAQHLGDRLEHRVAGRVAVRVVDLLEVVEVEHDDRARVAVADGAGERLDEARLEAAAVEQRGQQVVVGDEREARREVVDVGRVADRDHGERVGLVRALDPAWRRSRGR